MNIDEMPAGRELDALVAEKVMGLNEHEYTVGGGCGHERSCGCRDEFSKPMNFAKPYSTDIAAAWEVVEKLRPQGFDFHLQAAATRIQNGWWNAEFSTQVDIYWAEIAESAPLAICRAALKAVGL